MAETAFPGTDLRREIDALQQAFGQTCAALPGQQECSDEAVARAHGYRDWNTARAALPDRIVAPWQVGSRVKGLYLDQPFTGMLIGVQLLGNMQSYTVTIQFDEPVNVTPTFMFAALRHRVVSTIDLQGTSYAMRGNGNPQLVLKRA